MKRYSIRFEDTTTRVGTFSNAETGFVVLNNSNCKASFSTYFSDDCCCVILRKATDDEITIEDMARMAKAVAGRLLEGE